MRYRPNRMAPFHRSRGHRIGRWLVTVALMIAPTASAQSGDAEGDPPAKPPAPSSTETTTEVDEAQALAETAQTQAEAAQTQAKAKSAPKPAHPQAVALRKKAADIEALMNESLSLDVDPHTLFHIDLTDPATASVEVRWLSSLLERVSDDSTKDTDESDPDVQNEKASTARKAEKSEAAATADEKDPESNVAAEYATLKTTDPELWSARLELDRARLRFLNLPEDKRQALLNRHIERQNTNEKDNPEEQLTDAERKEARADAEHSEALEAARLARSEAARLVAEERARLLAIASRQAKFEATLLARREKLEENRDESLALQRRVRQVLAKARAGAQDTASIDHVYEQVREVLRSTRDTLGDALANLTNDRSEVPGPGGNPLEGILQEVDQSATKETRRRVEQTQASLRLTERELWTDLAENNFNEMETLDDLRLELVPYVSDQKRMTITGLGPGGLDQAFSEAKHVILVLRYHHNATTRWLQSLTEPTASRGKSALTATLIALKWVLPFAIFVWWRRRAKRVLNSADERVREDLGDQPLRTQDSHPALRALHLIERIRSPLEWLLLIWAFVWFLPPEAKGLLEVELVRTILTWTLGGAIAVRGIDFLAGAEDSRHRRRSMMLTAHLRLRSLRLVGRAVVVFGLILGLTNQLVGRGTIYSWVFTLLWFAAAAIFLVLVKWWRNVIFERVASKRKKTRLDNWVTANQTGWKSFVAALVGGAALFSSGVYRVLRSRVSAFSITRQILAYLFQRDMSRQAEEVKEDHCRPLRGDLFKQLSPLKHSDEIVASVADRQLDELIDRINAPGGGVFAIVGERGSGKTTLLKRIAERADDIVHVQTPYGALAAFEPAFLEALTGSRKGSSLDEAAKAFDAGKRDAGVLIDNAHRLITPTVGGFAGLDEVLSMARTHSKNIAWVLAFDEVIWRLLQRMRGTKPLFDDVIRLAPWTEEGIVSLLTSRNETVGIEPSFDGIVGQLEEDADEIDYDEALTQAEENYLRLLWHYSAGNPGLALHAWRMSLGIDDEGKVKVRVFQAPNPSSLEGLPDASMFVLRAIVQMERASIEQICDITHLPVSSVQDVVRFGRVKGYIHESEEGIGITWTWFRAVTKLLQRRHLLYAAHD